MKAYIFANGEHCPTKSQLDITDSDLVIAADGGSHHCQQLGLKPDILVGDLDSTSQELQEIYRKEGVEIISYPMDKDQTDLELALLLAQDRGADLILVFGAVGGRLDMTFGNLTLLAHPKLLTPTTMVCGLDEVRLLQSGDSLNLVGTPGDTVSLIPLQPGSSTVTAQGLQYPLDRDSLDFGFSRGISNIMTGNRATISLDSGLLVIVHTRHRK
jgi:thiamine pyrophosphokinase